MDRGLLVLLLAVLVGQGQSSAIPPARTEASVRSLPTFATAAKGNGQAEVTIRWVVTPGQGNAALPGALITPGPNPETNQFEVLRRRGVNEAPVRERNPQLAVDELVIVAVGDRGDELAWQHVKDPRIVRSEQPGPDGVLRGQVFFRPEAELVVHLPDAVTAARVLVYSVEWNGTRFVLRGLGSIPIPR